MIDKFEGQYSFLSNFEELNKPIVVGTIICDTTEHFYQMHKTLDLEDRLWIAGQATPGAAKRAGNKKGIGTRKIILRKDWNEVKFDVMLIGLILKFMNNYDLAGKLVSTHPKILVEGNWWHDNIWGNCTCANCTNIVGQNHLGLLLMKVRDLLLKIKI